MQRGFTLLELIVVVIIIGILATLGIQQFGRAAERFRGAEARQILGQIRTTAAGYRLEHANSCVGFDAEDAGIGEATDQIPSTCQVTHYFKYEITGAATAAGFVATATRCTTGSTGKPPLASTGFTLILTTDFALGTDAWTGTGGY